MIMQRDLLQAKGAPLISTMRITEERLAQVFLDSWKRRLLLGFASEPLSVSQAAERAGQPLARIHYHVLDLLKKGLLRVDREEKRKGRPIKYYRAVATAFFVPLELLDRSPGAGLAAELRARLDEELFNSPDDGIMFYSKDDEPRVSWFGQSRQSGSAGEFWQIVNLTEESVQAFAAELRALMNKYDRKTGEGRTFLLHAAFAPR